MYDGIFGIKNETDLNTCLIEKPNFENAPSNLASIGRYVLTPDIFDILRNQSTGVADEIQLADAINIQALKNITGDRKIVVFASTRKGEEFQIIKSYRALKSKFNALLLIVPRHPERFNEVFDMANETGLNVERRSLADHCDQDIDILIGDSMGEMTSYLNISDIAFIGGSLTNNGGQNMLEAAALSKPIIFGPSVFNFEEISKGLLDDGSAIQVSNAEELMKTISELLLDEEKRRLIGESAKTTFENNRGATTKIFKAIAPHIKEI